MKHNWPIVKLGEVLTHCQEYIDAPEPREYPKLSVKLYGKGVVLDTPADGANLKMKRHQLARTGQVILSEIWGKNGAIGFVPPEGAGALCTSHFFLFDINGDKLDPRWLRAIFTANYLQKQLDSEAKGTTGYAAVRPKTLLACDIPLPPLAEQRRIVARIDELATHVQEVRALNAEIENDLRSMVTAAYRVISNDAPKRPLCVVAPLCRRPVTVEIDKCYPQVSVRSFGRGTFHKPPLVGSEVTWEKPFLVKAGDLLVSNIKAWEGALAVATPEDDGRFGSHRYLTFVPVEGLATARFICFHLLTPEGLEAVCDASPGTADRNRTLSAKKILQTLVPVPEYSKQVWFDSLCSQMDALKRLHVETATELDALMPSILDRAFKGEL